jgi:hypothetical protein
VGKITKASLGVLTISCSTTGKVSRLGLELGALRLGHLGEGPLQFAIAQEEHAAGALRGVEGEERPGEEHRHGEPLLDLLLIEALSLEQGHRLLAVGVAHQSPAPPAACSCP